MTDTQTRRRQSAGTPVGGQFATEARTEPQISLTPAPSVLTSDQVRSTYAGGNPAREAAFDQMVTDHEQQASRRALADFVGNLDTGAIVQDWSDRPGDRDAMRQAADDAVSAITQSVRDSLPAREPEGDALASVRADLAGGNDERGAAFDRWASAAGYRARARALNDFAGSIDLDAVADAAAKHSGSRDAHWAAGNAASAVQMAAHDSASAARRQAEAQEAGR